MLANWCGELWCGGLTHVTQLMVFVSSELEPRQSKQKVTLVLLSSEKGEFLLVSGVLVDNTGLLPFSKEGHRAHL